MTWFGWLTLGVLLATIVVLVVVIMRRKPTIIRGFTDEEQQQLAKLEREQGKKLAHYDAVKMVRLEEIAKTQQDRLAKLELAYKDSKNFIFAKKREEFETYLRDANSAGRELDKLLDIRSESTDKKQKERSRNEGTSRDEKKSRQEDETKKAPRSTF